MVSDNELWINQENVVISAESHDVWRFTPIASTQKDIADRIQPTKAPGDALAPIHRRDEGRGVVNG